MGDHFRDEVVDDSEPEREAFRQREQVVVPRGGLKKVITEVIEITDDDEPNLTSYAAHRVVDISDVDSGDGITGDNFKIDHFNGNVESATAGSPLHDSSYSPSTENAPKLTNNNSSLPHASSSNGGSDDKYISGGIDLARFAYLGVPASSKSVCAKPGLSRQSSNVSAQNDPRAVPRKRLEHRFSSEFSDAELAKLTKCVSCDIRWTARKTATQKMMHVQSCAKKNSFNDETIRILIRKELEKAIVTSTSAKGKAKATANSAKPNGPQTFFEDIVSDAASKRKGRRVEASETVKSITATRDVILDKARAVLGRNRRAADHDTFVVYTQSVGATVPDVQSTGFPSTQAFGESSLGQKYVQQSRMLFAHTLEPSFSEDESEAEVSSRTQNFAPSKLDSAMRQPGDKLSEYSSIPILSPSSFTTTLAPSSHNDLLPFPILDSAAHLPYASARDRSPSPAQRMTESLRRPLATAYSPNLYATLSRAQDPEGGIGDFSNHNTPFDKLGQKNDDAYLHFNPGFDNPPIAEEYIPDPVVPATPPFTIKKTQVKSPRVQKSSQPKASSQIEPKAPSKRKTNVKRPAKQQVNVEIEFEEAWETILKDKILQDHSLHLRILRYEPIHFDVFLQLASEEPPYSGKLKARLRSFLDQQAIHFYGAEPTGRTR